MTSKKCVIHFRAFADRMSLREIEADVVEFSPILASREHFLSVNLKPFFQILSHARVSGRTCCASLQDSEARIACLRLRRLQPWKRNHLRRRSTQRGR